jgi:hypothetical protein
MRKSNWSPSIVPRGDDQNVHLVADDLGRNGRCWRGADYQTTDLETVIQDLLSGEYHDPIRVIGFNTNEVWSQDVSEDIAHELRRRCDLQMSDVPSSIQDFVERHAIDPPAGLTWPIRTRGAKVPSPDAVSALRLPTAREPSTSSLLGPKPWRAYS